MRPVDPTPRPRSRRAAFSLAAWCCALLAGFVAIHRGASIPGEALAAPAHWPASTTLPLDEARPTLLLFAHPNCPCTRATVRQLASVERVRLGSVRAIVVLSGPAVDDDANASLAAAAAPLLRAEVVLDPSGEEARRFGASTSGHVALFSTRARTLFSGGVTPGRGHEGRCESLDSLNRALRDGAPAPDAYPVFGCPIFNAEHNAHASPSAGCCAPPEGSTHP